LTAQAGNPLPFIWPSFTSIERSLHSPRAAERIEVPYMILDDLVKAIEQGKPLRVRYFGGSSPGGERVLQPLSVKDGKVRARCLSSGATKTFAIEKMELAIDGMTSFLAVSLPAPAPLYPTVHEFVSGRSALFYDLGWIVLHAGNTLSLHRTFQERKANQDARCRTPI
jgi:hypothetical protein